jgi:hypothetical protein
MPSNFTIDTTAGLTLYMRVFNSDTIKWWNTATGAYESFNASNVAHYAISPSVTTIDSGVDALYAFAFPVSAPESNVVMYGYQQAGGSPSVADGPPLWGQGAYWNGTSIVVPGGTGGSVLPLTVTSSMVPGGVVTDNNSVPLANVSVTAYLASLYNAGTFSPIASTLTSDSGTWSMQLDYGTTYVFTFFLSGYNAAGTITYTTQAS